MAYLWANSLLLNMPFVTKDVITVADVQPEALRVLGICDDAEMYQRLNEAVELLANMGIWDPLVGYMDICTTGCEITLPDDVEVPLAVNVGGHPADFRNKWFEFHLNGPGSECCSQGCSQSWQDMGNFPTFRDPIKASYIAAYPEEAETITTIRVYGFDTAEKWIMTADSNGVLQDGFDVPVIYGLGSGFPSEVKVKRITRVSKPVSNGFIKLVALDDGSTSGGTLLGLFKPSDVEPMFRRIKVSGGGTTFLTSSHSHSASTAAHSHSCACITWVRMRFRKKMTKLSSSEDVIFLHSVTAIKQALMAIKKYEADLAQEYNTYLQLAKDALNREQKSRSGPNRMRIQFDAGVYGYQCGDGMV